MKHCILCVGILLVNSYNLQLDTGMFYPHQLLSFPFRSRRPLKRYIKIPQ